MAYTPILATLGYVVSKDRESVLMIRRTRHEDPAFGKYNGVGGKLNEDEDCAAGMAREVFEETGVTVTAMHLRGTLSWPGFGGENESWFGFVFVIDEYEGAPGTGNHEGELEWVRTRDLVDGKVNTWPGDRLWLPLVFDDDPRPFHGVQPYDGFEVQMEAWAFTRL
ncbi:MAG: 8-oxo-dGTP diphosphatase [Dehalococcoidia bacterium]|nr:8-oxo-dGTP diphosphatase [Dehalococcoidia bacterium]MCB9485867.1 8-oxo-dGTP diphosphatase [Thermoflexaceae bacterium]